MTIKSWSTGLCRISTFTEAIVLATLCRQHWSGRLPGCTERGCRYNLGSLEIQVHRLDLAGDGAGDLAGNCAGDLAGDCAVYLVKD
jgi:hypothetical protein